MIERLFLGRKLPAFYEITLSDGKGSDKPLRVPATMLDAHETTREDAVYTAVADKAEEEAIEDLEYSLRLMRPGETRKYLSSRTRQALESRFLDTPPVQRLTQLAVSHIAVRTAFEHKISSTD